MKKKIITVLLVGTLMLTLSAGVASAHVRAKDKHRMCNGYDGTMRHHHGFTLISAPYDFITNPGGWDGHFRNYTTHRDYRYGNRNWESKLVNCWYW